MKQVILGLAVLALLAIPVGTSADEPPTKVAVCHVNGANGSVDLGGIVLSLGRVISVSGNAVSAHERHGDNDSFFPLSTPTARDDFVEMFGVRLVNANCFTFAF